MSKEQEDIKRERDDIEWVMSTLQGRRFMWRLLSHCGVYKELEGDTIPQLMKQEGKRSIGLFLMGITADVSQAQVFTMMREAESKAIEEQIKHERENNDTPDSSSSGGYTSTPSDGNYYKDFLGLPEAGDSSGIA